MLILQSDFFSISFFYGIPSDTNNHIKGSYPGVSFRVPDDASRTHSTFRAADSLLLRMGSQYCYANRACGYLAYFFNSFRRYSASLALSDGERSKSKSS